jgi:hypothetical protein
MRLCTPGAGRLLGRGDWLLILLVSVEPFDQVMGSLIPFMDTCLRNEILFY